MFVIGLTFYSFAQHTHRHVAAFILELLPFVLSNSSTYQESEDRSSLWCNIFFQWTDLVRYNLVTTEKLQMAKSLIALKLSASVVWDARWLSWLQANPNVSLRKQMWADWRPNSLERTISMACISTSCGGQVKLDIMWKGLGSETGILLQSPHSPLRPPVVWQKVDTHIWNRETLPTHEELDIR